MIKATIISYDESNDVFTLRSACEHTFDDFTVPAIIGAALVGEYGEPYDFIGKVVSIPLP